MMSSWKQRAEEASGELDKLIYSRVRHITEFTDAELKAGGCTIETIANIQDIRRRRCRHGRRDQCSFCG